MSRRRLNSYGFFSYHVIYENSRWEHSSLLGTRILSFRPIYQDCSGGGVLRRTSARPSAGAACPTEQAIPTESQLPFIQAEMVLTISDLFIS